MELAYQVARENLNTSSDRSKNHYHVRTRHKSVDVGDWVLFCSPRLFVGKSPKFQRNYSGPFLVIRRLSHVLLVIQNLPRSNEILAPTDKLKPCYGEHPPSWLSGDKDVGGPDSPPPEATLTVSYPSLATVSADYPVSHLHPEAPSFRPRIPSSSNDVVPVPFVDGTLPETNEVPSRSKRNVALPLRYRQ